mmetsp:Transcript_85014/g.259627  ORF Transcript_85014/g.259627 Transcript_85014/m.259627 type:complete len:204 (-) Transcript_85014:62-673(-)
MLDAGQKGRLDPDERAPAGSPQWRALAQRLRRGELLRNRLAAAAEELLPRRGHGRGGVPQHQGHARQGQPARRRRRLLRIFAPPQIQGDALGLGHGSVRHVPGSARRDLGGRLHREKRQRIHGLERILVCLEQGVHPMEQGGSGGRGLHRHFGLGAHPLISGACVRGTCPSLSWLGCFPVGRARCAPRGARAFASQAVVFSMD